MAIIIITYLMNDTIMSVDDIERKLGLNVLGTLPLEAEEEYDGRRSSKKKPLMTKKATVQKPVAQKSTTQKPVAQASNTQKSATQKPATQKKNNK
jgi:hypothetical protein